MDADLTNNSSNGWMHTVEFPDVQLCIALTVSTPF